MELVGTRTDRVTWVEIPDGHGFGIDALPYGSFTAVGDRQPRVGVAIGDLVLDVTTASRTLLSSDADVFAPGTLDGLMAAGPETWSRVRDSITDWLTDERHRPVIAPLLHPASKVTMHLPFTVADYVDFYASLHHATNLGRMFRPGGEPLPPNWKHLPLGYHGRAGTVVVSGTPVHRPNGQHRMAAGDVVFGPSDRLDIEVEMGFVVGVPSPLGQPITIGEFDHHVFGVCLVNDWSARDIQAWEYQPLGPFLGKSFATSVSAWVLPLVALDAARIAASARDVELLPYLDDTASRPGGFDIKFEVHLNGSLVSRPSFTDMYWTGAQMLAHLTSNGASLRTGDLFASGTVSGAGKGEQGSLIELSANGGEPLTLSDGRRRTFLEDGDEVVITATAPGVSGDKVGLGEVRGTIVGS
jgi:fumarylacetoacetase